MPFHLLSLPQYLSAKFYNLIYVYEFHTYLDDIIPKLFIIHGSSGSISMTFFPLSPLISY